MRLPEEALHDVGRGLYRVDRNLVTPDRLTRAYQPWHADVETDPSARWKGYLQPETATLRNLVAAETPAVLRVKEDNRVESRLVELAARPVDPTLDLHHLREIHRRLFQDVYPWAGETRTVDMGRPGGPSFIAWDTIGDTWEKITELVADANLKQSRQERFVQEAAQIYNWINTTHAFREGNGRTQREWMNDLARHAGYALDWDRVQGVYNDRASQAAREGDLQPLREMFARITRASTPTTDKDAAARRASRVARSAYPPPATEATRQTAHAKPADRPRPYRPPHGHPPRDRPSPDRE